MSTQLLLNDFFLAIADLPGYAGVVCLGFSFFYFPVVTVPCVLTPSLSKGTNHSDLIASHVSEGRDGQDEQDVTVYHFYFVQNFQLQSSQFQPQVGREISISVFR